MATWYFIIAIVLFILLIAFDFDDTINCFLLGIGITALITSAVLVVTERTTPKAIDVYRGKTVLQITYEDNIPVDSVVVYKNK